MEKKEKEFSRPETITVPDQSTSVCRNDAVWIEIYVSRDAITTLL